MTSLCLGLVTVGIAVVYRRCCPRCGGDISSVDVAKGFCRKCATDVISWSGSAVLDLVNRETENFTNFFTKLTGFQPWSLQRYWIKRLIAGESFAMVAPTGVGKSTLLAVYALYRAYLYKSKVYILTPTKEIAKQMYKKISEFVDRGKLDSVKLVFYDSLNRNADLVKEAIKNGDFDILITSAAFLSRHQDLVMDKRFDLVIADDLDSIMKNSKSVDKVLTLLGFSHEDIELALRILKIRQNIMLAKASNSQEVVDRLRKELVELEAILRNSIAKKNVQLVVASATGRAKGLKSQILKLLLGFDAGAIFEYWRNIVDLYYPLDKNSLNIIVDVVKRLGSGIVFVSSLYREMMNTIVEKLRHAGLRVGIAKSGDGTVDKFRRGEIDVVVGSASYYGILVRGLDEPIRTRYTIFVGTPSIVRNLQESLNNPRFLFMVLRELQRLGYRVEEQLNTVIKVITSSTPSMLYLYAKLMKQGFDPTSVSKDVSTRIEQLLRAKEYVYELLRDVLDRVGVLAIGRSHIVVKRQNKYMVIKPDPYTYIQASGRCSRLLKGGKTFGVTIVFEEYPEAIAILENILKKYIHTFSIKRLDISDLDRYIEEIERSRTNTSNTMSVDISTALIIVESPTKAKTIANMFGKPAKRILGSSYVYETLIPITPSKILVASIISSLGHITDIAVDEGTYGVKVTELGYTPVYDFITRCRSCGSQHVGVYDSCPYCDSLDISTSLSTYNIMKVLASQVDIVFIATDPDTEGEKIAFDIYSLLLPYNRNIYRIEFREVTRSAIIEALNNPRGIDMKRVEAQIARRIADRWIGFEVSLWLQAKFGKPWLGAGRVQSPVLLWVSSKYREYKKWLGYVVVVDIGGYKVRIYVGGAQGAKEEAQRLAGIITQYGLGLESIEFVDKEMQPPPPFTTDSLLQEANIVLGYSTAKTMALAQTLFELGLITYHRTDSTRISTLGMAIAREVAKKLGLESMFTPRSWDGGSAKEDAHEAIRPTSPFSAEEIVEMVIKGDIGFLTRISSDHVKLYDLVFRRFIASQMPSARVKYLRMRVAIDRHKADIEIPVEVVSPGFTMVYPIRLYTDVIRNLDIVAGRVKAVGVAIVKGSSVQLYRVADVIRMMKDRGIGRPSTYAKAIDNNIRHGYMILSKRKKVLIPTKLGLEVADAIDRYFLDLVGENTTKHLEELLDSIEIGRIDVNHAIDTIRSSIDIAMRNAKSETMIAIDNTAASIAIA